MLRRVAILDDWDRMYEGSPLLAPLQGSAEVTLFHQAIPPEALAGVLREYDAVIPLRERTKFTAQVLESLPNLRHIAQTGQGVAHIDLPAAARLGVQVSTTPRGSSAAVAELTIGLMLAVAHRIAEGDRQVRVGQWPRLTGTELAGKTLGLIGLGAIGREVARRLEPFGMRLLAWSRHLTPEQAQACGAAAVSLDELLAESDYLSIHLRLSPQSKGLLDYARLQQAKPGAILINTARGPIAPGADLLRALQEGRLGGAGLDVFDEEPLPVDHPIRSLPNVVLTPHVGWTTRETYERFLEDAAANVAAFYAGAPTNLIRT